MRKICLIIVSLIAASFMTAGCSGHNNENDDTLTEGEQNKFFEITDLEKVVTDGQGIYFDIEDTADAVIYNYSTIFIRDGEKGVSKGIYIVNDGDKKEELLYDYSDQGNIIAQCGYMGTYAFIIRNWEDNGSVTEKLMFIENGNNTCAPVPDDAAHDCSLLYTGDMLIDRNKNVYFAGDNRHISIWNNKFETLGSYDMERDVVRLVMDSSGEVWIVCNDLQSLYLYKAEEAGAILKYEIACNNFVSGARFAKENVWYFFNEYQLAAVDFSSGEVQIVADLEKIGISSASQFEILGGRDEIKLSESVALGENTFVRTVTLSEVPETTVNEITLGLVCRTDILTDLVWEYNISHPHSHISILDYGKDGYEKGVEDFKQDLIDGNIPDIIVMDGKYEMEDLANKGIFADLNEMLESDPELGVEGIVPGIRMAFTYQDCLYALPSAFQINGCISRQDLSGDTQLLTMDEVEKVLSDNQEAVFCSVLNSADFMLSALVAGGTGQVADTYGNIRISRDDIMQVLEFCNKFSQVGSAAYDSILDLFHEKKNLVLDANVFGMFGTQIFSNQYGIKNFEAASSSTLTFVAYPFASQSNFFFFTAETYSISASSKHRDEAWEFVRTCFLPDYQMNYLVDQFPVNVNALSEVIEELECSEAYKESLKKMIDNTSCSYRTDSGISKIFLEEAGAYFSGEKSAKDVADIIYSRLLVYIGERY